jgi:haloalkane dehalogenase
MENEPPDVHEVVVRYRDWLATSDVPKLFIDADPGSILVGRQRELVRGWPALTEVTVPGSHFVPEDSPHEIGRALAAWLPTL